MDPVACWKALEQADTRDAVAEHADDLLAWLEKGGFSPFGRGDLEGRWQAGLTVHQLKCYLREIRSVAEMSSSAADDEPPYMKPSKCSPA